MKPVVHYWSIVGDVEVGRSAIVFPLDHPNQLSGQHVSNRSYIITSTVLHVGSGGEFETVNTVYRARVLND